MFPLASVDSPHPCWAESRLLWDCCKNSYDKIPQMVPVETPGSMPSDNFLQIAPTDRRMVALEGVFKNDWENGKPVNRGIQGVGIFTQRLVHDIDLSEQGFPRVLILEDLSFTPPWLDNDDTENHKDQLPASGGSPQEAVKDQADNASSVLKDHPYTRLQPQPGVRRLTVVVRGSSTLADWLRDITVWPKSPEWAQGQALHSGFADATETLGQKVLEALGKDETLDKGKVEIRLTGHSLGGAVAALMWLPLNAAGYHVTKVVTFGQPKVTDKKGAEYFNSRIPLYRFVNQRDVVAVVPPAKMNYYHFGYMFTFQRVKYEDVECNWFTSTEQPSVLRAAFEQLTFEHHRTLGYLQAVVGNKNELVKHAAANKFGYRSDHPLFSIETASSIIYTSSPFGKPCVDPGLPVLEDDGKTPLNETDCAKLVAKAYCVGAESEAKTGVYE